MKKEFVYKEFLRKEENILRAPYNPELEFYSVIKSGDLAKTEELCRDTFSEKKGLGKLSENSMQNLKYHFAITVALIARYCIDGGMDVSTSYALSDFYIQKADVSKTPRELDELHAEVAMDYARRMKKLRKDKICSIHVVRCIDYIHDNLHSRITIKELAEFVELEPSYLSRLFKKETGVAVSEYIQQLKIEAAQNMLLYSDFTPARISTILAFPDQSYFTQVFKKYTGVTPRKFQSMHLREISLGNKEMPT
ncbi:MAG: AraC family transcriptional regulator [Lachnospiraceae bacterium]|nr:AraC family transcriptional regulator [Lachnospiraceae bacterium]